MRIFTSVCLCFLFKKKHKQAYERCPSFSCNKPCITSTSSSACLHVASASFVAIPSDCSIILHVAHSMRKVLYMVSVAEPRSAAMAWLRLKCSPKRPQTSWKPACRNIASKTFPRVSTLHFFTSIVSRSATLRKSKRSSSFESVLR
jgi:hypothetical protein